MKNRSLKNKNILVTGGAGFIGSHLIDNLINVGAKNIFAIDNMFLGKESNLKEAHKSGVKLYKDDIEIMSSLEYIFREEKIDIVFNCATKALNYSFLNPSNAFTTNVNGVINLLECQRKGLFESLCHFSSSEVYGSAIYEPMDEAHPKNPTTLYAAGKASADMALESYVKMYGLDAFIVRPFNNYGPRQNYEGFMAGIIPITAQRIISNSHPELHGNGLQTRDFIYVHDTVDAVIKVFNVLEKGDSVNISTDNCIEIKKLIEMIVNYYGYSGKIETKPARDADVFSHIASNEKINRLISYRLTPFEKGLSETLEWYKEKLSKV
tara:strand:+ start:377 stop:1345 length:969 start_codon:yes stop_codon:yes gene_type:complete